MQPGDDDSDGVFLVRAGDLVRGTVDVSNLRKIPINIDAAYERSRLAGGEVLITVVGANIGTAAIAPDSCRGFNIARAVAKIPISDLDANYIFHWLSGSTALRWMKEDSREVARPTLNLEQLRTLPIPIPPVAEQHEIVRRLKSVFALADRIEQRLESATAHTERIAQSIRVRALEGELVPTEAELARREGRDYEPASALLECIRSDWEAAAARPQKSG